MSRWESYKRWKWRDLTIRRHTTSSQRQVGVPLKYFCWNDCSSVEKRDSIEGPLRSKRVYSISGGARPFIAFSGNSFTFLPSQPETGKNGRKPSGVSMRTELLYMNNTKSTSYVMRFPPCFRPVSGLGGENVKEYRQISSLANVSN